jgi:hypothetical protein
MRLLLLFNTPFDKSFFDLVEVVFALIQPPFRLVKRVPVQKLLISMTLPHPLSQRFLQSLAPKQKLEVAIDPIA